MKTALLVFIAALLVSVVAYLAWDRHEKNVAQQQEQDFDQKYIK